MANPAIFSRAPLWVIIADGTFDQICETADDTKREIRDLKRMGLQVVVKIVSSWEAAYAIEDRY